MDLVGKALLDIMNEQDIDFEELHVKAGVSRETVVKIISGGKNFRWLSLEKICDALNVKASIVVTRGSS